MTAPVLFPSGEGQGGFTLVEVLAALAVASFVLVSLNLASGTVRRGVDQARESLGSQAAVSAAIGIFRRDVAGIVKLRQEGGTGSGGYLFEGSVQEMIYPVNELYGASPGGLYRVRLRAEETETGMQLIRDRQPILPGEEASDPAWRDAVVLLDGPFDVRLAYRAQRTGERRWQESWSGAEAMPEQVRLTIGDSKTGRLRVPVIVQALLVDAEAECTLAQGCGEPKPQGAAP
jgi:prepilin-type N-terminal cleavage/methylation domain-containing protein